MDRRPNPAALRAAHAVVLSAVMGGGRVSRAELARATGLSKQTMSEVFRDLEAAGWLEVTGRTTGGVGRSAATYALVADRALIFGADLGGTKLRGALADLTGRIVAETEEPTTPAGGEAVVEQIGRMCDALAARLEVRRQRILVGTVGIPGAVDPRSGKLTMVPNIRGLEGGWFRDALTGRLDFALHLDNDVNLAAKGEQWCGEGADLDSFVFISLGTGIGMGIIDGGRILRGARGAAGEISLLPVGADPFDGRILGSGALETAVGSKAIRDRYVGRGGAPECDVRQIVDKASEGEPAAMATLDEVARVLAVAVLGVSAVLDPQRVVLGGGIGARPELVGRLRDALGGCMIDPPDCVASRLGSRAGLLGCIAFGLDRLREGFVDMPLAAGLEDKETSSVKTAAAE